MNTNEVKVTITDQDELDMIKLETPLDAPRKMKGKDAKEGGKKGNPYWRVRYGSIITRVEDKASAELIATGEVGKISLLTYDEEYNGETIKSADIISVISADVMERRVERQAKRANAELKIKLLDFDNFTANPEAFKRLQALTQKSVEKITDES